MKKEKKKQMGVLGLTIALVVVLIGGVLFVGAVSGWFDDGRVELSPEFLNAEEPDLVDLSVEEYGKLVDEKKSFIVFIDQDGCTTADKVREFVKNLTSERKIMVYRMMFRDMKETSLHDGIKYYPSVALVSHGKPVVWLRADSDEDADAYNDYDAFLTWINKYL